MAQNGIRVAIAALAADLLAWTARALPAAAQARQQYGSEVRSVAEDVGKG
jgi:hypothetical protein